MKNNSPGGPHVASTSRTLRRLLPREALIGRDKEWLRELNEQRQNAGLLPLQETRRPKAQRNELLWLRQTPGWMSTHSPVWCAGRYNPITAMSGAGGSRHASVDRRVRVLSRTLHGGQAPTRTIQNVVSFKLVWWPEASYGRERYQRSLWSAAEARPRLNCPRPQSHRALNGPILPLRPSYVRHRPRPSETRSGRPSAQPNLWNVSRNAAMLA